MKESNNKSIAIYGLGTETERYLNNIEKDITVVGLLDGYREEGEIYGYPIIPLCSLVEKKVESIIVVARPGSCKAITKKIGSFCRDNNISLFDVRGKNLLETQNISYSFENIKGYTKEELLNKAYQADVISFDLFDTLITRKVYSYSDIWELMEKQLHQKCINISNFTNLRLFAEKELSKSNSPSLEEIYDYVLEQSHNQSITSDELANLEYSLDCYLLIPRNDMISIYEWAFDQGKKIVITTDSYYSYSQIEKILNILGIKEPDSLFVSSEYKTLKNQELFEVVKKNYSQRELLHIGDDEYADIDIANSHGLKSFRIYSGKHLYDELGGIGLEDSISSLPDRIKLGLFISSIFNSPFVFESIDDKVLVKTSYELGYLFFAPMISDFIIWINNQLKEKRLKQILFCARDGYLPNKMFKEISTDIKSVYFLSSRTAAIRAGIENEEDIEYVDSMKYSGDDKEKNEIRYGLGAESGDDAVFKKRIIEKALSQKKNYLRYINSENIEDTNMGLFDFVAKGTSQFYLQKLFTGHLKGFYFLQLEPEYMANKGLDIVSFYTDEEKENSAIYENYYILETILTAPFPQLNEFDDYGNPVYSKETRSRKDIECFEEVQRGILDYFYDYISIVTEEERQINKKFDERILSMINKVKILDENFMSLKVEDPFFGRTTDISDLIG